MANSKLSANNQKILVKVDQNNLMYIDPNSVISNRGEISPRGIEQEKLVMYVNLEADIIPRSILAANNDSNTLTSIAKGTLNFLRNQTGRDYDSSWTDSFFNSQEKTTKDDNGNITGTGEFFQSDSTGQSFGIDSITISVKGANFVPQVNINFIDVRGKTLFESAENSPYKAFFHIPWPIFYLTVKGFYGKAIRYRLHLVKFNTKFNDNNGNFEVSTSFVGSTYAYLNDIPLRGALNGPYMYMNDNTTEPTFNTHTGVYEQKVSKTSRGYSMLKSVYSEYKQKKLIPEDFPVKTVREVGLVAKTLDKILEREIFDQVADMKLFTGLKDFDEKITAFETEVKAWGSRNLSVTEFSGNTTTGDKIYYLSAKDKTDTSKVLGATSTSTLEKIVENFKTKLKNSELFTNAILKNDTNTDFKKEKILSKTVAPMATYVSTDSKKFVLVDIDRLVSDIHEIRKVFTEQRDKFEQKIEEKINDIVKSKDKGIGFEPTVRNLFAVLLANAEVYIRLMKETHRKAFDVSEQRKSIIKNFTKETIGDAIYPWPEIKKPASGQKQMVIAYPGEPDLQAKLQSNNKNLWPEIDFLENFVGISTNKYDPHAEKEGGVNNINFIFGSDVDGTKVNYISSIGPITTTLPYTDKTIVSFLYEIWERAQTYTLLDSFDNNAIRELANIEFDNIKESIKEDSDIIGVLCNNVKNEVILRDLLLSFSPFERHPYYDDSLPTLPYLKELSDTSHKIEQYIPSNNPSKNLNLYEKLRDNLLNYKPESYRNNIYPFSSDQYISYLNIDKKTYDSKNGVYHGLLDVNAKEDFITSVIDPNYWVKSGGDLDYMSNLFAQKLTIGKNSTNILNTPYFHKQLKYDFNKESSYGKYSGSAYLLLNSLPFVDLDDEVAYINGDTPTNSRMTNTRISSLFREIGATHFLPYHMILKWGSIYHRYKKHLLEGVDILEGFLGTGTTTTNIDGQVYFNIPGLNGQYNTYDIDGNNVDYNDPKIDVGIHPWYDAIYHQVVNGYNHFDIYQGSDSYETNLGNGSIKERVRPIAEVNFWTGFVDNSIFDSGDQRYTLLPCDGANENASKGYKSYDKATAKLLNVIPGVEYLTIKSSSFVKEEQYAFRVIWEDEIINNDFSGYTFPSYSEYNKTYVSGTTRTNDNIYALGTTYRKVMDLIGTFNPKILDEFEDMFLQFAKEKKTEETSYVRFEKVKYYQFQDLLKEIVSVKKEDTDPTDVDTLIDTLKTKQKDKLTEITNSMLSNDNLLRVVIGNPKEIDSHIFNGFAKTTSGNTLTYNDYNSSQYTTGGFSGGIYEYGTKDILNLYLGEEPSKYNTTTKTWSQTNYYQEFFVTNNIEFSEENILQLRPLVLIYAGYRLDGGNADKEQFRQYISDNIFLRSPEGSTAGSSYRLSLFLNILTQNFGTLTVPSSGNRISIVDGYNNRDLKIELYNYFKSFNDKWVAGNSLGSRLLMEEFLFLDKANKDIGDKVYINLERFIPLVDIKNAEQNLYGAISMLIQGTGFDMRGLPAYVNFYGANLSTKTKITPSAKVAENIFGTFLEVDYQESSPKIVIQYTGPVSKHPDMESKKYKFADDSFNIANVNNNPLIITTPDVFNTGDLAKSNKVVAFEVSFGDQNQSIFKGVQLDQSSIRNTTESFVVLENLARSESGSGTYNVDIGLFDYYRQASYTCEVTCMGNVMIQPTMFFYLKNIPMFKGSYWITEVSHNIKGNNISTTFKGTRIPYASLPDPKDSFLSSYKTLFDKLTNTAIAKIKEADKTNTKTSITVTSPAGNFSTDPGSTVISGEEIIKTDAGITPFGVPFNGFGNERYIQKVKYKGKEWFRAVVVRMGSEKYQINDDTTMSLINEVSSNFGIVKPSSVKWSDLKDTDQKFYSTKFQLSPSISADKILSGKTMFLNPNNKDKKYTLNHDFQLNQEIGQRRANGPVSVGPSVSGYGIAMSTSLMSELGLLPDQVVYFDIS